MKITAKEWSICIKNLPAELKIKNWLEESCTKKWREMEQERENHLKEYIFQTGLEPKEIRMMVKWPPINIWEKPEQYGVDYWFEPLPPYMGDYVI